MENLINVLIYLEIKNESYCLRYPELLPDEYKNYFDCIKNEKILDIFSNKNKIENKFILITIFPFLKKEIIITKKNPIYDYY